MSIKTAGKSNQTKNPMGGFSKRRNLKPNYQKSTSLFLIFAMLFQIVAGAFLFAPTKEAMAATSWLSTFTNRVKVPVSFTASGAQTDYQMSIVLHSKSGTNAAGDIYLNSHLQDTTTFNDIRFTTSDGNTLKNFWIEKIEDETGGRKATVWVKLDTPASGTTDYYLYYGKTGDTSASSYDNTFTKDYGETGLAGLWHMDEGTPGSELLTDGGLETWTNSTTLTNWTNDSASVGVRDITQETTNKQAGSSALKLTSTANDGTAFGVWQSIPIESNQTYQVNFYQYFANRTAGTLKIEAWDNNGAGVSLGSQSISTAGTSLAFTSFRFTSTNTTTVKIKIYLNSETTSGIAYIDSLSVRQSSNSLTDSSGNNNTGTINGASRTATDGGQWGARSDTVFNSGSALQFDGKDDYVDAGSGAAAITGDLTIEAWINKADSTSTGDIVSTTYLKNDFTRPYDLMIAPSLIPCFYLGNGTTNYWKCAPSTAFQVNTWNYVVGTISGNNISLYVNGVFKGSSSFSGTRQTNTKLTIGAGGITGIRSFNGSIDEVRVYNRALSSDEISRQYVRSKYATVAPTWATPVSEEQLALGVSTQAVNVSAITTASATLNGSLTGFGGDTSATVSFKYGLASDNLNQTTATQAMTDYGSFSQGINGLSPDTTYYYQATVTDSAGIAYGSVLSFQTAALDTNYYRTIINSDGTLTFINKDTGAVILNSAPQYNLNYGSTTDVSKNPSNNSFEIDSNTDGIPDNWLAGPRVRLSSDQANDGVNSLKFNMTSSNDTDHRRAYSSILSAVYDKYYTINIDSYISSYSSGSTQIFIAYYNTDNGTGTEYSSPAHTISTTTGSWQTSSFDWTPPISARSFRILLYSDNNSVETVYFDNVRVVEKAYDYTTNGGNLTHTLTTNGSSSVITAVDNNNPYTKITHRYELDTNSPYIKYTATLQYKQNVNATEERFDFMVPTQSAQIMNRDLQLSSFDTAQTYRSDLYTPKVVKFDNGLSFLGSDTMDSMRLRTSGTNSQLSFYSDYKDNHPHFYYSENGGATTVDTSYTKRSINDTYSTSVTFTIDSSSSFESLVKTRQPYGYDSALLFTDHADDQTLARIKAVAYGTEDSADSGYGAKGIAGRGLGWTKSVFVSGQIGQWVDLGNEDFKSLVDQMHRDGVEIIGHTITPYTDNRTTVLGGLDTLAQYGSRNWIDHSATGGINNWEDLASQGALKSDSNYILDILDQYNYKYAWSYVDLTTSSVNHDLNMLQPVNTSEIRPLLFYNNNVDDNLSDNKKIYLWSSAVTNKTPDLYYTNANVDSLISERGVHIGHEYMAYSTNQNHAWYINPSTGKTEIYPAFDAELAYIAQKKADGLVWSPTVSTMGDYLVPLKDVLVVPNADGTYTVTNSSSASVTGITLLAENDIQSVTIDGQSLISFGGLFGSKELVLPTLAPNQSVNLSISYGTKDTSLPTIISNDTGKTKVNEITGVYNSVTKSLTMTAEGNSAVRSFTVKVPALANKNITVHDNYLGTTIGNYQASGTGEIIFSSPLGSLHTFEIAEDVTAPAAFTLATPADNSTISNRTPMFSWNASSDSESGLSKYQLYIDNTLNQDNLNNSTNSIFPSAELSCGDHSWYVKAIDNNGNSTNSNTFDLNINCAGGFTPPTKPNTSATTLTLSPDGKLNLSNLPADITQIAISTTSDFKDVSWEDISKKDELLLKYADAPKLYLKFKTRDGAVSDIVTYERSNSDNPIVSTNPYPTGTLLKLPNSPRVYVIIDGKKKWISTPEVFEQLGYKWTDIKIITETELNTLPDYEDNLIRQQGDYKVYLIVNGIKRHIPNPEVFLDYGFSWSDIKEVDKTIMDKYKETFLIKESGKNEIYYITNSIRKWIPTMDIFNSYSDKMEDVQIISKKEMESYPLSNLIKLNNSNDVYLTEGNIKKHIPNPTVFNKYKLNWNYVMSVNQVEFSWYKDGGDLK